MTHSVERLREDLASDRWRAGELCLRLLGAVLQVLATWALTRALAPEDAGIYFRGFVIALGLSTLLRGKYEIHMARHIIGQGATSTGLATGALLRQLARYFLLRSGVLSAILLVVTADLDIQAPQLQTVLQTYLPFVLAIPCVGLTGFLGEALRAANRTLGIVISTFTTNLAILLAVVLAPKGAPLALYSWAFLLGGMAATGVAMALARRHFPARMEDSTRSPSLIEFKSVDALEFIGVARGGQLWGPLCILSVLASPLQMAQYAVAARTALIVDFFLPALNLADDGPIRASSVRSTSQRRLFRALATSLFYSSALVVPLMVSAPATLALYGSPYNANLAVYPLLLGVQWVNGLGRPAVRTAAATWDLRRIGMVIGSGAVASVLVCSLGIARYGAVAAAAGSLIGALVLNGGAILVAYGSRAVTRQTK
jgi:hypothetical protein